jgi:hypothetical protein
MAAIHERLKRQCDNVRRAIDEVCQKQGRGSADDYIASLLWGTADYLISFRSRREAYNIIQKLADTIIEEDLPR